MGSSASQAAEDVKQMPSRIKQDIRFGLGLDKFGSTAEEADYRARTKASVARMNAPSQNDDRPRQSAPPRAAPAPDYGIGAVAAAPSVPNPDAIGETEQALLDQQKKGRSSTIATSAKGLLSGEDDTRKKRSIMGSLIT